MKSVAIVLGTYNRLACLQNAIASIRASVGAHPYLIIVSDGGSTDGTLEYLDGTYDIHVVHGGLDGAVKAFNLGFETAVEVGFDYVMHLNDDAEILTAESDELCPQYPIAEAISMLEESPKVGEIAFALDLRGCWGFEKINSAPYANFGVIRREAGMAVARTWDPDGKMWWNPIYRTYGADCEFGARMWQLGWEILPKDTFRVHDVNHQDELRAGNTGNNKNGDSERFWSRWRDVDLANHVPERTKLLLHVLEQRKARRQPQRPIRRRSGNPEYKR